MEITRNATRTGPRTCCLRLRWKGMFIDVEHDPHVPNPRDGFCWCSLTMTCLDRTARWPTRRAAATAGAASKRCRRGPDGARAPSLPGPAPRAAGGARPFSQPPQAPAAPVSPAADTPRGTRRPSAATSRSLAAAPGGPRPGDRTDLSTARRTPGTSTAEAIRASQRRARELFENVRYTVDDLFADGDRVAARYTVRATRKGGGRREAGRGHRRHDLPPRRGQDPRGLDLQRSDRALPPARLHPHAAAVLFGAEGARQAAPLKSPL